MFRRVVIAFKQFSYRSFTTPLGFVGCGVGVGIDFARNLLKAGAKLTVYDLQKKHVDTLVKEGAIGAKNPGEVASNCEILFSCLPGMTAIIKILDGPDGVNRNAKKGLLYVDLSTIGPVNALRLQAGFAEEQKIEFLSAPICGSNKIGEASHIMFLVGGKKEHMERIDKYMKVMAGRDKEYVSYVGPEIGDGQAARMCNILLSSTTMVAVCEVMILGRKLGINANKLVEVLNSTSAQCWACEHYNPVPGVSKYAPSNRNYTQGHYMRTVYQSLSVCQDMASKLQVPIPTLASAIQIYTLALSKGLGNKDFSAVIKVFKDTILEE